MDSDMIGVFLLVIIMERCDENGNEIWFPLMLNFLMESPYGKAHGYQDMEDVIEHFERRRRLELRILREIIRKDGLVLEAKSFAADIVPDCCLHIR